MQNRAPQAIAVLEKANQMAELALLDSDDEYLPGIYFYLASAYDKEGEIQQAGQYFRKVLKCSQNDPYKEKERKNGLKGK